MTMDGGGEPPPIAARIETSVGLENVLHLRIAGNIYLRSEPFFYMHEPWTTWSNGITGEGSGYAMAICRQNVHQNRPHPHQQ